MPTARKLLMVFRFLLAGIPGVFMYYVLLYTLTDLLGMWYMTSAIIASVVNVASNFLLQKFWTFGDRDTAGVHRQAGQYIALFASLFFGNLLILYVLIESAHLWYMAAQVVSTVVITSISYFVSRRIFAARSRTNNSVAG